MPSSSMLGAAGAAENADLFQSGWIRFDTESTDVGVRTCDDSGSIGESILVDNDSISAEPSGDNTSASSSSAAARAEEGSSQRRIVASAPMGRDPASGGRPDAAGSFRVGGYVATAEAFEAMDPWVGLEQYNIDRLMGA
jgi:hypothetical protein